MYINKNKKMSHVSMGMLSLSLASLALLMPYAYAVSVGGHNHYVPPRSLIIGGVEALEGRYTYTVSLKDDTGSHFCGGSLISNTVVLTAAHCVAMDGNDVTVVIGRHNLTNHNTGEDVPVSEVVLHPNYDMRTSEDYDIALVILSRPVTADVNIMNINANSTLPVAGSDVTYLGWGEIDSDAATLNVSDTLREVESNVITNEQCNDIEGIIDGTKSTDSYNGLISDVMLCTFTIGRDSCQKDSGGPLIIRGKDASEDVQVGVASWGLGCASKVFPGVACRISYVYSWIKDVVCDKSSEPALAFECDINATLAETEKTTTPMDLDSTNLFEVDKETDTPYAIQIERPETPVAPESTNGIESDPETIDIEEMPNKSPGMPGQTNDFDGDTTRSFATIGQTTTTALGILMFEIAIQAF